MFSRVPCVCRGLEQAYERPFERDTVNAARFITHLRYFFVRAQTGQQLDDGASTLSKQSARPTRRRTRPPSSCRQYSSCGWAPP